jgi:hypothetical protein
LASRGDPSQIKGFTTATATMLVVLLAVCRFDQDAAPGDRDGALVVAAAGRDVPDF